MDQMLKLRESIKTKISTLKFRRKDKVKFRGMAGVVVCVDLAREIIECDFKKDGIWYFNLDGTLCDLLKNKDKLEKIH